MNPRQGCNYKHIKNINWLTGFSSNQTKTLIVKMEKNCKRETCQKSLKDFQIFLCYSFFTCFIQHKNIPTSFSSTLYYSNLSHLPRMKSHASSATRPWVNFVNCFTPYADPYRLTPTFTPQKSFSKVRHRAQTFLW